MKKDNVIQRKSYEFAIKIVHLCKNLMDGEKEFVLSKQLLRSGTSIGANVEEAVGAQSRKDFNAKLSIAYKEARETSYWIRIMQDTGYVKKNEAELLLSECEEIRKILAKIQITLK